MYHLPATPWGGGEHRDRGRFALPQANFLKAPIVAPKEILHFTYGSEPKEMIHQIQNSLHRVNIGPGGIKLSSNMLINDVSVKENKLRCFLWFRQNAAPKPGVVYMEESLWLQCIWAISLIQSMLYSELQPIVISMLFNTHFILKKFKDSNFLALTKNSFFWRGKTILVSSFNQAPKIIYWYFQWQSYKSNFFIFHINTV